MAEGDGKVVVPEVATVSVSKPTALRLFVGSFIVDFVETFAALLVGVTLFMPANSEDWQKLAMILLTPAVSAFVSAGRRAWPQIRKWLKPEIDGG
jgi:hypothetical protein